MWLKGYKKIIVLGDEGLCGLPTEELASADLVVRKDGTLVKNRFGPLRKLTLTEMVEVRQQCQS